MRNIIIAGTTAPSAVGRGPGIFIFDLVTHEDIWVDIPLPSAECELISC